MDKEAQRLNEWLQGKVSTHSELEVSSKFSLPTRLLLITFQIRNVQCLLICIRIRATCQHHANLKGNQGGNKLDKKKDTKVTSIQRKKQTKSLLPYLELLVEHNFLSCSTGHSVTLL